MTLQSTTRGIEELVYNLGTSLERFKGVNGLQRLVTAGKLSLLSLFGEFERTRDEVYEKRTTAVSETRRCLVEIAFEFEGISGTVEKLVRKIDHLLSTLECFHRNCDLELDDRSAADDSDARQLMRDFAAMRETNSKLKDSLSDFCTSTSTCADLTRSAVAQLEEVNANTYCEVSNALTDFDKQRRKVQIKESEVTTALSRASSRQDPAVHFAEYNLLKESQLLEGVGKHYISTLAAAMTATAFALEQSSMTGWASSNVFFVQVGLFCSELAKGGVSIASNLLSIKNAQKISRQLTDEKRQLLYTQQAAGVSGDVLQQRNSFAEEDGAAPPTAVAVAREFVPPFTASPLTQQSSSPFIAPGPFVSELSAAAAQSASVSSAQASPTATTALDLDDLFH